MSSNAPHVVLCWVWPAPRASVQAQGARDRPVPGKEGAQGARHRPDPARRGTKFPHKRAGPPALLGLSPEVVLQAARWPPGGSRGAGAAQLQDPGAAPGATPSQPGDPLLGIQEKENFKRQLKRNVKHERTRTQERGPHHPCLPSLTRRSPATVGDGGPQAQNPGGRGLPRPTPSAGHEHPPQHRLSPAWHCPLNVPTLDTLVDTERGSLLSTSAPPTRAQQERRADPCTVARGTVGHQQRGQQQAGSPGASVQAGPEARKGTLSTREREAVSTAGQQAGTTSERNKQRAPLGEGPRGRQHWEPRSGRVPESWAASGPGPQGNSLLLLYPPQRL